MWKTYPPQLVVLNFQLNILYTVNFTDALKRSIPVPVQNGFTIYTVQSTNTGASFTTNLPTILNNVTYLIVAGGGGGGGGGGGAAAAATTINGGDGIPIDMFTGNIVYYGGGGAGGGNRGIGAGGNGGGGGSANINGTNGLGGGGAGAPQDGNGGNGGSGIIILMFKSFQ